MKATYIQPEIEIVRIRLISSVLDDTEAGVYGGSKESEWGQAAEGKSGQFDETDEMFSRQPTTNVWSGWESMDDL